MDTSKVSWHDFRAKYREFGGDGYYAAWKLTYLEPAFLGEKFADCQEQTFASGLCPAAEEVQPRVIQLKTNYLDKIKIEQQAEVLRKTIDYFEKR